MINIKPVLQKLFKTIESIKPQDPKLCTHLTAFMKNQGIYYNETKSIYCVGETVDKLLFISEGFITRSAPQPQRLRLKKLFSVIGIDLVEAFNKRYHKMLKPQKGSPMIK